MKPTNLVIKSVRCPKCKNRLEYRDKFFTCQNCQKIFHIIQNVTSLIDMDRIRKIDESDMRDSSITMLDMDKKNYVLPEDWDTVKWEVFDNRAERRMNKVLKYVNNDGVHLDIGCGRGDGVALVGRKKLTIGIDFGMKSCLVARNLHPHIIQADVAELPFPDTYFDSITILDVMEHILEPKKALDEMKRVLKNNGILVLQTPSLESDKIKAIGRFLFKFVILPSKVLFKIKWLCYTTIQAIIEPIKFITRVKQKLSNLNHPLKIQCTPPQPIEILRKKEEIENMILKTGFNIIYNTRVRYWNQHKIIWLFSLSNLWIIRKR